MKIAACGLIGVIFYVLFFAFQVHIASSYVVALVFGLTCGVFFVVISCNNSTKKNVVSALTNSFFVSILIFWINASDVLKGMVISKYWHPTGDGLIGCLSSLHMVSMRYYSGTYLFLLGILLSQFVVGTLLIYRRYELERNKIV